MNVKGKLAIVLTWLAGLLSFAVSWLGLVGAAFTSWGSTPMHIQTVSSIIEIVTIAISFPVFLLFLRRPRMAVLLQWLAVILCIASFDVTEWGRSSSVAANLCAAFSAENAVFVFPLSPAILLTILAWLKRTTKSTQQTIPVSH